MACHYARLAAINLTTATLFGLSSHPWLAALFLFIATTQALTAIKIRIPDF